MIASTFRDALLGGVGGLAAIGGMVVFVLALAAIDRRRNGEPHRGHPE